MCVLIPESIGREDPVPRPHDAIRSGASGCEVIGPYDKVKGASGIDIELSILIRDPYGGSVVAAVGVVEDLDQEKLSAVFAKSHEAGVMNAVVACKGEVDERVVAGIGSQG